MKIKDFILNKENFLDWYEPFKETSHCQWFGYLYWKRNPIFKYEQDRQIKSDNAVQSIIINSLEKSNQEYLQGYIYMLIVWLID